MAEQRNYIIPLDCPREWKTLLSKFTNASRTRWKGESKPVYDQREFRSESSDNVGRWRSMGWEGSERRIEEKRLEERKSQKKQDQGMIYKKKVGNTMCFPNLVWPKRIERQTWRYSKCARHWVCRVAKRITKQTATTTNYYRNEYTTTALGAFTHRFFYTEKSLHRGFFYTQMRLHTEAFTQRSLYTEERLHTKAFTHSKLLHTQGLLHREAFTQRSFAHTEGFTQRSLYSKGLLHTKRLGAFTHKSCYTKKSLHREL